MSRLLALPPDLLESVGRMLDIDTLLVLRRTHRDLRRLAFQCVIDARTFRPSRDLMQHIRMHRKRLLRLQFRLSLPPTKDQLQALSELGSFVHLTHLSIELGDPRTYSCEEKPLSKEDRIMHTEQLAHIQRTLHLPRLVSLSISGNLLTDTVTIAHDLVKSLLENHTDTLQELQLLYGAQKYVSIHPLPLGAVQTLANIRLLDTGHDWIADLTSSPHGVMFTSLEYLGLGGFQRNAESVAYNARMAALPQLKYVSVGGKWNTFEFDDKLQMICLYTSLRFDKMLICVGAAPLPLLETLLIQDCQFEPRDEEQEASLANVMQLLLLSDKIQCIAAHLPALVRLLVSARFELHHIDLLVALVHHLPALCLLHVEIRDESAPDVAQAFDWYAVNFQATLCFESHRHCQKGSSTKATKHITDGLLHTHGTRATHPKRIQ
jgi:hypothetical protein